MKKPKLKFSSWQTSMLSKQVSLLRHQSGHWLRRDCFFLVYKKGHRSTFFQSLLSFSPCSIAPHSPIMPIIDTSHLLEKAERYSAWASYTKGILLKNNCEGAILESQSEITAETIKEGLIQAGFDAKGLSVSILVKELRD